MNTLSASVARALAAGALLPLLVVGCAVPPPVAQRPLYAHERPAVRAENAPMYFYPERGQPEAQLERDRYECYRWAVAQTGVDPGMTTTRAPRAPEPSGPTGAGAAVGGIAGATVGAAVSGPRHAGENMVLGAIFGAVLGAAAEQSQVQQQQARRAAIEDQARAPNDNFRRAMSACMSGRGYRVG